MKRYPVMVSVRGKDPETREMLVRMGLSWDGIEYHGYVTKGRMKKIRRFAEERDLIFRIENEMGRRRADYRRRYFSAHSPDIGSRYICVYCGKWMRKEDTTVDHLYPVGQTARDLSLQKKLEKKGIRNVNDPRNLVASCHSCNARKGDSMGLWILKGRIGRHAALWALRYLLRAGILALALYGCIRLVMMIQGG